MPNDDLPRRDLLMTISHRVPCGSITADVHVPTDGQFSELSIDYTAWDSRDKGSINQIYNFMLYTHTQAHMSH